ncbi:lysylphosphatidylglycerol synthase transmembrane domain-containing protein [Bacillus sp. WLY-B-L8]|uniref:lysylphosphatidylglycerol synthase transmembrane domain-containing protein n=1 Tax=Bacillus multifaciens TaxID=3068506 RepID=UPI002740DAE8|nr:lysylphosphatidylglycerol synthase transmembrane domain-containing protein [Bacillus sp. WLY-B-L8]MDP7977375.1 lysylphosphatidylglycerol synthase transmembrane domain-containing protein [Bacillus sp. WLY-B-L8]
MYLLQKGWSEPLLGRNNIRIFFNVFGVFLLCIFFLLSWRSFEVSSLWKHFQDLWRQPYIIMLLVMMYSIAFLFRAYAWKLYLHHRITMKEALYGLLYSLFINHVSPLKVGDAVRIAVITKEKKVTLGEATQSVVVLRILDLFILGLFGATGMLLLWRNILLNVPVILACVCTGSVLLFLLYKKVPQFVEKQWKQLKESLFTLQGGMIVFLIMMSWICEAFVIYEIAKPLSFLQAVWVNSVTIAGQVFQLTPGGIGTYETVMTFALQAIGAKQSDAYQWSLMSHGFKFIFSYGAGVMLLLLYPMELRSFFSQKGEDNRWKK